MEKRTEIEMDLQFLYDQFLANVKSYIDEDQVRNDIVLKDIFSHITPDNVDEFVNLIVDTPDVGYSMFSDRNGRTRIALMKVFCILAPCLPSLNLAIKIYEEVDYWNDGVDRLRKLFFKEMERSLFFQLLGKKCDKFAFEREHCFFTEEVTEDEVTEDDLCDVFIE